MSKIDSMILEMNQLINKVDGRKTKEFRMIAAKYKKTIQSWNLNDIYDICDILLRKEKRAETIIAYQILFDNSKKYDEDSFKVFENFLYTYIKDWWDCDDFMTHAFMALFKKFPDQIKNIHDWIQSNNFAVRRSAPVVLIRLSQANLIQFDLIKEVCMKLMNDEHYLVQKGYGWLLKESVKNYKEEVIKFLKENVNSMPRVAFRYAIEKLSKEEKDDLMKLV